MNNPFTNSNVPDEVTLQWLEDLAESGQLTVNDDGQFVFKDYAPIEIPKDLSSEDDEEIPNPNWSYDERGFSSKVNSQGGRENKNWNDFLREMRSSKDPLDRAVAQLSPTLFVFLDKHYTPEKGTYESRRMYYNNNKQFMTSSLDRCVHQMVDCFGRWVDKKAWAQAMKDQGVEFWNVDQTLIDPQWYSWEFLKPGDNFMRNPRRLGADVPNHFFVGARNATWPDYSESMNNELKDSIIDSAKRWFEAQKSQFIASPFNPNPRPLP